MPVVFEREYYEKLCGTARVQVKLATAFFLRDLVEAGLKDEALALIDQICNVDERKHVRAIRQDVYARLRHAQQMDDSAEIARWTRMLNDCTDAAKCISV